MQITVNKRIDVGFDGKYFDVAGQAAPCLLVDSGGASEKWLEVQNNSLEEYEKTHVEEKIDPGILAYYRLFKGYASSAAPRALARVLDVGCGISPEYPVYSRRMEHQWEYVGLDPFAINLDRKYPFICATLEAAAENLNFQKKFDLFLFCTSLDHFENIELCAASVKKLADPEARCVFWVGLHDPDLVAAPEGAAVFRRIFKSSPIMSFLLYLGYGVLHFPRTVYNMWRRRKFLAKGTPLDDLHFWYFTRVNIEQHLRKFGEIEDMLFIPGCNYVFATCRVKASND